MLLSPYERESIIRQLTVDAGSEALATVNSSHFFSCKCVLMASLNEAVQKLLEKGAIDPEEDDRSLGFYSRLFLIPKQDSGN